MSDFSFIPHTSVATIPVANASAAFTSIFCFKNKKGVAWKCYTFLCDPVGIQTQDLQNRNLTLYSAKLRDLQNQRMQN